MFLKFWKSIFYLAFICSWVFCQNGVTNMATTESKSVTQQLQQIEPELVTGQMISGSLESTTQFKTVKVLKIDQIKGRFLFFVLGSVNAPWEKMKIGIFRQSNLDNPLKVCNNMGVDACYLKADLFTLNENLVIGINCGDVCDFQFSTYWSNIVVITPGQIHKFTFSSKGKAQIYHVDLSKAPDFNELRIIIKPETKRDSSDSIKFYGNIGTNQQQPTSEKHDIQSIALFNGGEGIFMNKDELKGQKSLSLVLIGQTHNVFMMGCQLIVEQEQNLMLNQGIYEYLRANSQKLFRIDLNRQKVIVDEYVVSFAKLQGDLNIKFFIDRAMTKPFEIKPFQYMKDFKYIMVKSKMDSLNINELFMLIATNGDNSLIAVELNTRAATKAIELSENTYDFIGIQDKKMFVFHFKDYYDQQMKSTNGEVYINVNVIRVTGIVSTQFRVCQQDISDCLSMQNYEKASVSIKPIDNGIVGMKTVFKLQIEQKYLQQITSIERAGVIIAVLNNVGKPQQSFVAVQYVYTNAILQLREDHPIQELIEAHQLKHYKFSITDPTVEQVRVHVYEINGGIKVGGSRADPRQLQYVNQTAASNNIVIFKQKFNEPMYVTVQGLQSSFFSMIVQIIRHNAVSQINSISISEDISYTFRIHPKSIQIVKANPIFNSIYLKFKSNGGSVGVCLLNNEKKCHQQKPILSKSGQLKIQQINHRNPQFLLLNPSQSKYIEVVIVYHSADYASCQLIKVGQMYNQAISHNHCFNIKVKNPTQTIAIAAERMDLGNLMIKVFACEQIINKEWSLPRFLINKEDIDKNCEGKNPTDRVISLVFQGDDNKKDEKLKVQFTSQYKNGVINLLDGVAFRIDGTNKEGVLKTFYYKLVNSISTQIVLRSYRGSFKFFAKIIQHQDREKTTVNFRNRDFMSQKSNMFRQPSLILKPSDFQNNKCRICGIIIGVESQDEVGEFVEFSLQVVQNNIILKDNQMVENHLMKDSVAYFEYESHKNQNQCSIIVETSDNNKDCTKIYLSDLEIPSENNYLAKENGSRLTFPKCHRGHYYIAVEAVQDCPFSITASNALYSITKAERGIPVNVNLKQGEFKFVIFRHITNTGLKIVSMEKFGKVTIYATPLNSDHLDMLKQNKPVTSQFRFKSNFSNILTIEPDQEGYCDNCYYLAAVNCEKEAEGTIILADQETSIRLVTGKVLNDELLNKDDITSLSFSGIMSGSLPINVYNGKMEVTLQYKGYKETKPFQKSLMNQMYQFKMSDLGKTFDWDPVYVQVKCVTTKCIYSIGLIDETKIKAQQIKPTIVPGRPTYLFLTQGETQCITGFAKDEDDEIIITGSRRQSQTFNKINLKLIVNGKETTEYTKNVISNLMIVSFITQTLPQTIPYEICVTSTSQTELSALVEQGKDVNLLAQDIDRVIQEEDTFIIYPQGSFIVDIFECQGDTTFKSSTEEDGLQLQDNMNDLEQIGMPQQTHAIKLTSYMPTYLRVKSPLSIIRWLPMNEVQEIGVGYLKYGIGDVKYQTVDSSIVFLWDALSQKTKTNTSVIDVHYRIYISNDKNHLQSASNCQKFLSDDIIVIEVDVAKESLINAEITFKIDKSEVSDKFDDSQNVYMSIVADMALIVPPTGASQNPIEYYRFLYNQQQIPSEVFLQSRHQKQKLIIIIGIIAASVLGVLILAYVFLTKIVPMMSRMKNRMLIEEDPGITKQSKNSKQVLDENPIQSNERIIVDIN